jgi:hypothetical protein
LLQDRESAMERRKKVDWSPLEPWQMGDFESARA